MWDHNWTAETRVSKYPQHPLRRAPVTMPEPWRAVGGRLAGGWQAVGGRDECGATAAGQCAGSGAVREAWCTHGGPYRWCVGVGRCVSGGEGGGWRAVGGRLVGGWRAVGGRCDCAGTAPGRGGAHRKRRSLREVALLLLTLQLRRAILQPGKVGGWRAVGGRWLAGGWRAVGGRHECGVTAAGRRAGSGAVRVVPCAHGGWYWWCVGVGRCMGERGAAGGRLAGGWQAVGGRWAGGARAAGRGGAHLKRRCLRELARDVHVSSATTTTKPASQAQKSELVRLPSCWWAVAGGTGVAGGRRTALACGLAHLGLGEHRQCLLKDVRRCERQGGWASTDCVGRCRRR